MRTAVDTNVFSALLAGGGDGRRAEALLETCRAQGALVVSPVVYAEVLANRGVASASVEELLEGAQVRVDYGLEPAVWREAGCGLGGMPRGGSVPVEVRRGDCWRTLWWERMRWCRRTSC